MSAQSIIEQQADSFAEQFPEPDRAGVRQWYMAHLQEDARARFWKKVEAGFTVFLLVGALPTIALCALYLS